METQRCFPVLAASLVMVLLASGCIRQGPAQGGVSDNKSGSSPSDNQQQETVSAVTDLTLTKGMAGLCSSLHDCFGFCKSNAGRCDRFCKENPEHELCAIPAAAKPQAWVRDAITQPVPEGASGVRLVFFAPLDAVLLAEVGAFGAHRYTHSEGLDHEWLPVKQGVVMTSWADGYVAWARPDPGDAGYKEDLMNVVVYYGDGLWGEHMGLDRNKVLVKEGQRVKAGEPIGYSPPLSTNPAYQFGEFTLVDQHRPDGEGYWYKFVKGAAFVSPFDYLRDDVKQELEEQWKREILGARLSGGQDVGIVPTPWEPYLTNPLLFHGDGQLVGEWFLRSRPWDLDSIPDIFVFFTNSTRYYPQQRVIALDDDSGSSVISGDWVADEQNSRFTITTPQATYYGIFELDESASQARLKIEYQQGSYPSGFSAQALVYTERDAVSKAEERFYWQNPQYDPRTW